MNILEKEITVTYKFCYCLCADNNIARKVTEKIFLEKYNKDDLEKLKFTWQEFRDNYGYLQFSSQQKAQKALLNLPPDLRCGVVLRDVLGYDYSQIASVLSVSLKRAQQIVAQGRRTSQKYLKVS